MLHYPGRVATLFDVRFDYIFQSDGRSSYFQAYSLGQIEGLGLLSTGKSLNLFSSRYLLRHGYIVVG